METFYSKFNLEKIKIIFKLVPFSLKFLLFTNFCFIFVSLIIFVKLSSPIKNSNSDDKQSLRVEKETSATILVELSGAVQQPGIYELFENERLINALIKAEGLSSKADKYLIAKNFNLSKKLVDEEKIYFPFREERGFILPTNLEPSAPSINSSSQTELELLPNVGPVTAQKIIANRPFKTKEELIIKKVFSDKIFQKIKDLISL